MMQSSLFATTLLMGLVGGPHCVAMCGAACAGLGQAAGGRKNSAILGFQAGRVLGYSVLGALAGASMQGLGWLTVHSSALRPVWSMLHLAALLLGLVLLFRARQPIWLEAAGKKIWSRAKGMGYRQGAAPLLLGSLWALLPCGLLYSAVAVAALAGGPLQGAVAMALFAVGTSLSMDRCTLALVAFTLARAGRRKPRCLGRAAGWFGLGYQRSMGVVDGAGEWGCALVCYVVRVGGAAFWMPCSVCCETERGPVFLLSAKRPARQTSSPHTLRVHAGDVS